MPKKLIVAKKMPQADSLSCPKCGMELADTPKNRKYVAMREEEADEYEEED